MFPCSVRFVYMFVSFVCLFRGIEQCPEEESFKNYLGTKTPYRLVANLTSTKINYEGCKARKFWSMVRHGTRNPNALLIDKMQSRLYEIRDQILDNSPQLSDSLKNSEVDSFRTWKTKLDQRDEKKLTHEGEDEMLLLAERMQSRFPEIFERVYSESKFHFKFTATQRTKKSAQYFAAGLFGRNIVKDIYFPEPSKKDPILRFYKLCNKWRAEVSKNPESLKERRQFEQSAIFNETIRSINKRLGFTDTLNISDIHLMYMVCAFETAWNRRRGSPWCSVFTIDDLKKMEYAEDLKYYWVDGYGHSLTYKQACPAFNDLIDFFHNDETLPKAVVYFTHSGTVLKMLAHLDLYKDKAHLRAADFTKNAERQWKVSALDAFGSNIAFILFDCNGVDKILTLHQENIVRLPSCPENDLCDLKAVVQHYNESIEGCTFDEMCDN